MDTGESPLIVIHFIPECVMSQAGAIPFRRDSRGKLEFLLISSSSGGRWVFPKGRIEFGCTAAEQAAVETYEEAGVSGDVHRPSVGKFRYRKSGSQFDVEVFLLQVTQVHLTWPEFNHRNRIWLPGEKALNLLGRDEAKGIFANAIRQAEVLSIQQRAMESY